MPEISDRCRSIGRRTFLVRALAGAACLFVLAVLLRVARAEDSAAQQGQREEMQSALESLNDLIGEWRGAGVPRRGATSEAWIEQAEWLWSFDKGTVAIEYRLKESRLMESARVTYDPQREQFRLRALFADEVRRDYVGGWEQGKLILESPADAEGTYYRLTVHPLNDKRTLVYHDRRRSESNFAARLAEVGYTRQGTSLAEEGYGELECVVTGGKGTSRVTYQGKTYWVCCSGCRQAFEDDPAGVIAAFEEKRAERKRRSESGS